MNITRHLSLQLCRRQSHGGKRSFRQANQLFTKTAATIAVVSTTTLLIHCYTVNFDKSCDVKMGRQVNPYLSRLNILLQIWHGHRNNQTQCDSVTSSESTINNAHYSEAYDPDLDLDSSGYTEEERFYQCVLYHRSLLHDYDRRWGNGKIYSSSDSYAVASQPSKENHHRNTTGSGWPRNIPNRSEVTALEDDLFYCQQSPDYQSDVTFCHSIKFRIASYYVSPEYNDDRKSQREKGFQVVKELAEQCYPDAMCLYGILLNEGTIDGVEANPQQAVVWWRRCVDEHGHINSTYELANACYLGDGIVENGPMAVSLFRRAAHLGHAGAAYMLGECLLNGVGVDRDRTDALEWLVTSAELGHRGAQDRVLMILNVDYGSYNTTSDTARQRQLEEAIKWINDDVDITRYDPELEPIHKEVSIERRYTIGGGSRNPVVVARRKSIVAESRND